MAMVYAKNSDDGKFEIIWYQGAQAVKSKTFDDKAAAEAFAEKKMGRTGSILFPKGW